MYWLGLLTHLQSPEVPLKNLASLRDLVAMYEAAKVEDLYDALASFSLDDESVFTCIGVSGKTPPAQKDFQEQNKGNLLNAQVGRRNLCFAALGSEVWAGNEEIGSCMPFCTWPQHQPWGASIHHVGWQRSGGCSYGSSCNLPQERGSPILLDHMLCWCGVWQSGLGRGSVPPVRADEPALLCRLRRGSRKTPSGGHLMTEGLPDLRSTCLHVPACRCGNTLSARAALAPSQGAMVQAGRSSSRALISTPRRLPMLLSRPSLLP